MSQGEGHRGLDLSADEPEVEVSKGQAPVDQPYSPDRDREGIRAKIAIRLLWLVVGLVVILLVAAVAGWIDQPRLESLAAVILSPVMTLFGAVMGFYFGEKSGARSAGGAGS